MRLIDADAFDKMLKEEQAKNGGNFRFGVLADVRGNLALFPTVDRPDIVRCKECENRGNPKKCVLSAISEEKDFPLFMLDNRGDWYCADGKRR